jgi:ribonuclease HI
MKILPYIIYLEMQPNALLLRQNFDSQKVSVTCTNNIVEYEAILLGLRKLRAIGI